MRSNQTCLAQVVVDITRNAHRERSENIFASAVKRQIESQHQQKDSTHFLIATSPDPTPQKKNETDSRAGNFHLKRKIKKEVVAAFKSCISGDKLKMDFDEFDRFVKLAHLVPESESKLCANLIERSFVHAATLDDFDFDMSMMFDKDDEMKRKSKNYSMEKELAPGVSLESAVIFVCMFHGLVPMRDSKESKLIHELRSRNLMSTKSGRSTTARRAAVPAPQGDIQTPQRTLRRGNETLHSSQTIEGAISDSAKNGAMSTTIPAPRVQVEISDEARELYRATRWETVKSEVKKQFEDVHTFKPRINKPAPPRPGDRVLVDVSKEITGRPVTMLDVQYDEMLKSSGGGMSNYDGEDGGGGVGVSPRGIVGHVTAVHRDGSFDVRGSDGMEHFAVPALRVKKVRDVSTGSHHAGHAHLDTSDLLAHSSSIIHGDIVLHEDGYDDLPVHERLYAFRKGVIPPQQSMYRRKDLRDTERRTVDDHCTFRPEGVQDSPFVSERTLRSNAMMRRHDDDEEGGQADGLVFVTRPRTHSRSRSPTRGRRGPRGPRSPSSPSPGDEEDFNPPPGQQGWGPGMGGMGGMGGYPGYGMGGGPLTPGVAPVMGGLYVPGIGLARGPPTASGIPLYLFDPMAPPSFDSGTCMQAGPPEEVPEMIDVDEEVTDDEGDSGPGPKPPPLPAWAFTPGGDPKRAAGATSAAPKASNKIVITKKAVKEPPPAASGWASVLEEFQRRKGNIAMKKVEAPEKKAVGKLSSSKKKKKGKGAGFNDVIDELSHRLAVLRGDVVEESSDEEEEEEEVKPKGKGKKGSVAAAPAPAAAAATPSEPVLKPAVPRPARIPVPPVLDKSLFPAGPAVPPAAGGAEGAGGGNPKAAAEAAPASPLKQLFPEEPGRRSMLVAGSTHRMAVPKPKTLPAPPPLPTQWPPAAPYIYSASAPKKTKKRTVKKPSGRTVPGKATNVKVPLPPGYYLPCSQPGVVLPGQITPSGDTTESMVLALTAAAAAAAAASPGAGASAFTGALEMSGLGVPMGGGAGAGGGPSPFVPLGAFAAMPNFPAMPGSVAANMGSMPPTPLSGPLHLAPPALGSPWPFSPDGHAHHPPPFVGSPGSPTGHLMNNSLWARNAELVRQYSPLMVDTTGSDSAGSGGGGMGAQGQGTGLLGPMMIPPPPPIPPESPLPPPPMSPQRSRKGAGSPRGQSRGRSIDHEGEEEGEAERGVGGGWHRQRGRSNGSRESSSASGAVRGHGREGRAGTGRDPLSAGGGNSSGGVGGGSGGSSRSSSRGRGGGGGGSPRRMRRRDGVDDDGYNYRGSDAYQHGRYPDGDGDDGRDDDDDDYDYGGDGYGDYCDDRSLGGSVDDSGSQQPQHMHLEFSTRVVKHPTMAKEAAKIHLSDLPLPTGFHTAVQRLQNNVKRREDKKELEARIGLRTHAEMPQRKLEPTTPMDLKFRVDQHRETKAYTFRKPAPASAPDLLPMSSHVPGVTKTAKMIGVDDISSSYLLSTLRNQDPPKPKPHMGTKTRPSVGVAASSPQQQFQQSAFGASTDTVLSRGGLPRDQPKTTSRAPKFQSDEAAAKRVSARAEKKQQEQEEEQRRLEREKKRREQLHQRALASAIVTGAFDPTARVHPHEKMVAKYHNRPDVGLDLATIAVAGHIEYSTKHNMGQSLSVQDLQSIGSDPSSRYDGRSDVGYGRDARAMGSRDGLGRLETDHYSTLQSPSGGTSPRMGIARNGADWLQPPSTQTSQQYQDQSHQHQHQQAYLQQQQQYQQQLRQVAHQQQQTQNLAQQSQMLQQIQRQRLLAMHGQM